MGKRRSVPGVYYVGVTDWHWDKGKYVRTPGQFFPRNMGGYPVFNKTAVGAKKNSGKDGKVFIVDFNTLPMISDEEYQPIAAGSDIEFAERQMLRWSEIVEALRKKELEE